MRRISLPVTLAITLAVGGCGQKGPLYLPDKNAKVVTAPAAGATPATAQPAASAATPAAPATPQTAPKPNDKDQDPQQPPK